MRDGKDMDPVFERKKIDSQAESAELEDRSYHEQENAREGR
jgi:hypothetical protein